MKQLLLLFQFSLCLLGCGTKQWNINQTIGWDSNSNLSYLFVIFDTSVSHNKAKIEDIDKKVLSVLEQKGQGEITEQDSLNGIRPIYVVSKDYKRAVKTISEVLKSEGFLDEFTVVKRTYTSSTAWSDQVVFP
jgi:hypothetical protein